MKFNLNYPMRVTLNEEGIEILRKEHEDINSVFPEDQRIPFKLLLDDEGMYVDSGWMIMQTFGPHFSLGSFPPFSMEVEIVE